MLSAHGVSDEDIVTMLEATPRRVLEHGPGY
jgi:predicted metal-dependent phosphotriesterase family hydrolase